jgi:hypothetical protein
MQHYNSVSRVHVALDPCDCHFANICPKSVKIPSTSISSARISECPLSWYPFICPRYLNHQAAVSAFCTKSFLLELALSPVTILLSLQSSPMTSPYIPLNYC